MLTASYLRERLRYDPETGVLFWRPKEETSKENRRWNARHAGRRAGSLTAKGYVRLRIADTQVFAHQVVWCMQRGRWPEQDVDHKDRNKSNNRIGNLRMATVGQNRANSTLAKNNTSGRKGVTWHKGVGKWAAQTKRNGRAVHVGYFDSKEDAAAAYMDAAKRHFGEFATSGAS